MVKKKEGTKSVFLVENCQSAELKEFVCLMASYVLWEITRRIQKSPIKFKAISGVFRLVEFLKHIIFAVFFPILGIELNHSFMLFGAYS